MASRVGQRLRLPLLGREVEVTVGGVWRDYARQFGAVVMTADDYLALGGRFEATDLALWPRAGQEAAAQAWLRRSAAPWHRSGGQRRDSRTEPVHLRQELCHHPCAGGRGDADRPVRPGGDACRQHLAAARELATLAALGFDRAMLGRAVVLEGALIAAIGLLLGLACGIGIGAILTHVVNPQAFHWRMPLAGTVDAGAAGRRPDAACRHACQRHRRAPGNAPAGSANCGRGAVGEPWIAAASC
jgi:putative ABC transport system permease protein